MDNAPDLFYGRLDRDLLIGCSWGGGDALASPKGLLVNEVLEVPRAD